MKRTRNLVILLFFSLLLILGHVSVTAESGGPNGHPMSDRRPANMQGGASISPNAIATSVSVVSVWTADGNGNRKSDFRPGDSIRYYAEIHTNGGSVVNAYFRWSVEGPCGSIASWSGNLETGSWIWWLPALIPEDACGGTYTESVSVTHNSNTSSKSVTFTVVNGDASSHKVVLDPGHGWWNGWKIDPGCVVDGTEEKDIVLDISNLTKDILESYGLQVYMTRTGDDRQHTLSYAAQYVNQVNPDISVSIHVNCDHSGQGTGTEGWHTVGKSTDEQSKSLAALLASKISGHMSIRDRGAKPETDNRYGRLYIHDMNPPAALIETAFLTNNGDASLLRYNRGEFAQAIAEAILEYLGDTIPTGLYHAYYYGNMRLKGSPVFSRDEEASINHDWGGGSPGHGVPSDNFSARWVGRFHFDGGRYRFYARADDGIRVWVDDQRIIDGWRDQPPTDYRAEKDLSAGDHNVKVEYYENGGGAVAKVWWERTSSGGESCPGQYLAEYFNNRSLSGNPVYPTCEGWPIDHNWSGGSPGHGVPNDNFSARWTGRAQIDSGTYTFIARADDGIRVWLDGQIIINEWKDQPPTEYRVTRQVNGGNHTITVEYYEHGGGAVAQFRWEKQNGSAGQYYEIIAKHSGKCLDVEGARQDNSTNVQQWACGGGPNQLWRLERVGSYYKITAKHSGKCLDVTGGSQDNGANVIQWDCHNGDNQLWRIEPVGSYYRILAKHSSKALDVEGANPNNGANVQQWAYGGGPNQLWRIVEH